MSVFDVNNKTNHLKAKAFFDESGGVTIQRYDTMKYKAFDKLTETQLGFFWIPGEIDLNNDKADFESLTDHEKHIFTSVLSRAIVLDSCQGRSPNLAFLPIVSLPELETWIETWAFSETIHSRSYTHIIRNVYSNPSKVFDEIENISQITDCAIDIAKHYDELIEKSSWYRLLGVGNHVVNGKEIVIDLYELKKLLWMTIMSVNILEGIRFYSAFATIWSFAEMKRLEATAKIIKLICRDENCVSDDTEILTDEGWKLFKNLSKTEKVAQFTESGNVEFVTPLAYVENDYSGDMIHFTNKDGYFDMLVTPEHRVAHTFKGKHKIETAKDFKPSCYKHYYASGIKLDGKSDLTDFERFQIAFQADGSFTDEKRNGTFTGCIPVTFSLKKERKLIRIRKLLNVLGYDFTESLKESGPNEGTIVFYVKVPLKDHKLLSKTFSSWVNVSTVNYIWAREFLCEVSNWDGYLKNGDLSHIYYSSIEAENADVIQYLSAISGWKCNRSVQVDDRKESYSDVHRLYIHPTSNTHCAGPKATNKKNVPYSGKVYCVSVPSGMIVIRRNNKVCVTGNCHLASTQLLLKILMKDDPDFIKIAKETEQESIELFRSVVKQEQEWSNYVFKDGSIIGLNNQLLCEYIEWIANKRMTSIGLPELYKVSANPLPFTVKWIAGETVQSAPQEVSKVEYKIGGTTPDVSSGTFSGFKL